MTRTILKLLVTISVTAYLSGCVFIFQGQRRSDAEKIKVLTQQVDELSNAKSILEERLRKEIDDQTVKLKMMEKGLVITFVADVLFDSGKAALRQETHETLRKVARVLNENVPDLKIGIEGHTDNQPITVSGWKSNWELSVARALSVLHYLQDESGVAADRLSAVGYGEHRPVADNATSSGRQLNRRVEVVIVPRLAAVKEQPVEQQEPVKENYK